MKSCATVSRVAERWNRATAPAPTSSERDGGQGKVPNPVPDSAKNRQTVVGNWVDGTRYWEESQAEPERELQHDPEPEHRERVEHQ